MRVILVPVADRPECAAALQTSMDLGQHLGADLIGCHIRPHRESRIRVPGLAGGGADWDAAMRGRDAKAMSRSARKLLETLAGEAGYRAARGAAADGSRVAIWQERVGSPDRVMPIVGPTADMVVVSRPPARGGRLGWLFLMEALLHSCRPVLVLPPRRQRRVGRRVLIAWNQSPEASRAVMAAMPLLELADEVTIATSGPEVDLGPKASHLAAYLKHHGISADVRRGRGKDPAADLEAAYRKAGADLLLMGAYSRSRLRQVVFGGVTEHMLRRGSLPVMMYHG